jgi:4'-phosphopantetheinyl transferase
MTIRDNSFAQTWAVAGQFPLATPGHIHVWRVSLEGDTAREQGARAMLCPDELMRCDRFKFPHLRRRYALGRAALREILGHSLHAGAQSLRFTYGPQGKPALAGPDQGLAFNVSHSEDVALIAVGACAELGVDVEHRDPRRGCREIAQRFFSPEEIDALDRMPPTDFIEGFYRCWTRKEAYIKARGGGLSIPLTSFAVSLDTEPHLVRTDDADAQATAWSLFATQPGEGFEACVAARGAGGISWWQWMDRRPD